MSVTYAVSFVAVSVSAAQDLIAILAASNVPVNIARCSLSAEGVTAPADLRINLKRLPATVAAGSGGTTPVAFEMAQVSGRSASATLYANNTTRATTSGTINILWAGTMQQLNNYDDVLIPEFWPQINPAQLFVLGLEAAPGAAITLSGTVWFEELV